MRIAVEVVLVGLSLVVLGGCGGGATYIPDAQTPVTLEGRTQQCKHVRTKRDVDGAVSKVAAFVAGGSGIATLSAAATADDQHPPKALTISMAVITVVAGATAAGAGFLADSAGDEYNDMSCTEALRAYALTFTATPAATPTTPAGSHQ
jgi:hypothetical protein